MNKKFIKPFNLVLVAILSVAVMFFTACDPGSYHYDTNNLRAPVKSIELVNYDNPNQKHFSSWVPDHTEDLKPLDLSCMQTLAKLSTARIDAFMLDLSDKHILYKYFAYDSPKDICIKIVYEDNYFDLISCNSGRFAGYIGTYAPNGEVFAFIGCFDNRSSFEYLLQTYFDYSN